MNDIYHAPIGGNHVNFELNNELKKWEKKSKHENSTLTFTENNDNNVYFNVDCYTFSINIAQNTFKFNSDCKKLGKITNKINKYINNKSPRMYKILLKFEKEYYKSDKVINLGWDELNEIPNIIDDLDSFEIECNRLRNILTENIPNSKSILNIESKKIKNLYSNGEQGMILIEELMKLLLKYKNKDIKLTTIDNNVYHWNIKFVNFKNKYLMNDLSIVKDTFGYGCIEIDMHFHDKLFPMYPPIIKVIRPHLKNGLMNRIPSMHLAALKYWDPTRTIMYIIEKIQFVLSKHAVIDVESEKNNMDSFTIGAFNKLEGLLTSLSSFSGISDGNSNQNEVSLDPTTYPLNSLMHKPPKKTHNSNKNYWKKGTGYGHSGQSEWDVNKYLALHAEKDRQIGKILIKLIEEIQENSNSYSDIVGILRYSCFCNFMKSYLLGFSFLDADKHTLLYKYIFTMSQCLANENTIQIFDIGKPTLYSLLEKINSDAKNIKKLRNINNTENNNNTEFDFVDVVTNVFEMVDIVYKLYKEKEETKDVYVNNNVNNNVNINIVNDKLKHYKVSLKDKAFDSADIINSKYHYKSDISSTPPGRKMVKRISSEYGFLMSSLPIEFQASIFLRADDNNIGVCRALITGPHDTPYDCGCYIFDILFPTSYPNKHPSVWFINHGGVRFNPNLYDSGKVCLSLLGTWRGSGGESWNSSTSTLYQILMSIQSLILIEQPYFNEPSYEREIGNTRGNNKSRKYNDDIRLYTMKYSILDLLVNKQNYPEFRDVIDTHFSIKKNRIIKVCDQWVNEAFEKNKKEYKEVFDKIKIALDP